MKNGIRFFREKAQLTKAELARRAGINRQQLGRLEDGKRKLSLEWASKIAPHIGATPQELMFPELTRIDTTKFTNVFDIATQEETPDSPTVAFDANFLSHLLPNSKARNLRVMMVEASQANAIVTKGDAVVIDLDDNKPNRPGLYALEIAGVVQWRYLTPTTSGTIQVHSENPSVPNETVSPRDLDVIGRGRLRISTL